VNAVLAYVEASDRRLAWRLRGWRPPRWFRAWMIAASRLGDGVVWVSLGVCLALAGSPCRGALVAGVLAALVSNTATVVLKKRVRRSRPSDWTPNPFFSMVPADRLAFDRFSFPSGHTLNAFALGAAVSLTLPALAPLLAPLAVSVGISRVVLGVHYPSDVLAGAAIGSLIGLGAYLVVVG
jgi:undecaprenyl-diphosphatase